MSILRNSFWVTFSMITGRGAVVLAGMLISNFLGAAAFAAFAFAHVTATALSNMAAIGMQNALPRYFARLQVDTSADSFSHTIMATIYAATGLVIAVILALILPEEFIGLPEPTTNGLLAALLVVIGINNLCIGATNGLERFSHVSRATLAQGGLLLLSAGLAILFIRTEIALWGYVIATAVASLILLPPILKSVISRFRSQKITLNRRIASDVAKFCGPLFLASVMLNTGLWVAGRSLLGEEGSTQGFAEFALGLQWFGLASLAARVIGRVVMPRLTRSVYLKDGIDKHRTVWQGIAISFGSTMVVFIAVLMLSEFIISLYGPELSGAYEVLLFFMIAAILASPIDVISSALIAEHRQLTVLSTVALWWVTLIALLILIASLGLGVFETSLAIACSYAVYVAVSIATGYRYGIFQSVKLL